MNGLCLCLKGRELRSWRDTTPVGGDFLFLCLGVKGLKGVKGVNGVKGMRLGTSARDQREMAEGTDYYNSSMKIKKG